MAAWFADGEPQPFIRQNPKYVDVAKDNFGNYLFFHTGGYNEDDLEHIVRVPQRLPSAFTLAVENTAYDSVRVKIGGVEGGWVRTRLGEEAWGDWTDWEQRDSVNYNQLSPDDYRIEVEAMDKYLETASGQMAFTVKYDADTPVREAVEKLFSKNWNERNEAVKFLQRFPERARVLLKEIDRDKLDTNDRWWLDAALQQVEERK